MYNQVMIVSQSGLNGFLKKDWKVQICKCTFVFDQQWLTNCINNLEAYNCVLLGAILWLR